VSTRNWRLRIDDILDAIQNILSYTAGMDYSALSEDRRTFDAVIRNLEVIGKAAAHVPESVQISYPQVPWRQMKGIRNMLIHEYFGVDKEDYLENRTE